MNVSSSCPSNALSFQTISLVTPSKAQAKPVSAMCSFGVLITRLSRLLCQGCNCSIKNTCSNKVKYSRIVGVLKANGDPRFEALNSREVWPAAMLNKRGSISSF